MAAQGGRKLLVTVLGAVAGLCLALLLQQAGLVPLDRLSAFGLPAVMAGAAFVMVVVRTRFARTVTEWIAIIIIVLLLIVAAMGIPALAAADGELGGGSGFLKGSGNCTVEASSDLESLRGVPSMNRSDPFDVDPDGAVTWTAMSNPLIDHTWRLYVHAAGFRIPIENGGDPNPAGDPDNGDTTQVRPYADEVAGVIGGDLVGIFLVSGDITAQQGGSCEGQAWVRIEGGALSNLVGQGSLVLLVLLLVIIVIIVVRMQRTIVDEVVHRSTVAGDGGPGGPPDDNPLDDIGGGDGAMQ